MNAGQGRPAPERTAVQNARARPRAGHGAAVRSPRARPQPAGCRAVWGLRSGSGTKSAFNRLDVDGDRQLSGVELVEARELQFGHADRDGDGVLMSVTDDAGDQASTILSRSDQLPYPQPLVLLGAAAPAAAKPAPSAAVAEDERIANPSRGCQRSSSGANRGARRLPAHARTAGRSARRARPDAR